MKTIFFSNLRIGFLLFFVAGAIITSCTKKQVGVTTAKVIIEENHEKTGGDDEDPILRIRVKKKNGLSAVGGAHVDVVTYSTDVRVGSGNTNDSGEFDQQVPVGTYYLDVTVVGTSTPYHTDAFYVDADKQVTVLVD